MVDAARLRMGTVANPRRTVAVAVALAVGVAVLALAPLWGSPTVTDPGSAGAGSLGGGTAEASEAEELQVHVRTPSRLVLDHASPLEVTVGVHGGGTLPDDRRLAVEMELDLEPEATGWVVVSPLSVITTGQQLPDERFEMLGLGELPCEDQVGTMRVEVRELVDEGRTGSVTAAVPGAACDEDPPEAPAALHHDRPVRFSDWERRGEQTLEAPAPRRSTPAPSTSSPSPSSPPPAPDPEPEPEPEEPEPEEPEPEPQPEPDPQPEPEPVPEPDPQPTPDDPTGGDPGDGSSGGSGDDGSGDTSGSGDASGSEDTSGSEDASGAGESSGPDTSG